MGAPWWAWAILAILSSPLIARLAGWIVLLVVAGSVWLADRATGADRVWGPGDPEDGPGRRRRVDF